MLRWLFSERSVSWSFGNNNVVQAKWVKPCILASMWGKTCQNISLLLLLVSSFLLMPVLPTVLHCFFAQQNIAQLGRIVSWRGKHIYRIKISVKLNENKILIPLLWIEMSSNWANDLSRNSSHANHLYQGPRRFHVNPYQHFYISLHQHIYIYSYFNFIQL